ncbi:hypothetical protein KEJ19_04365 [Candidatus Bathyarchaeota archaeon]|nr:hypothetical protein [Candidatus Bathyarchaeota archaeon]
MKLEGLFLPLAQGESLKAFHEKIKLRLGKKGKLSKRYRIFLRRKHRISRMMRKGLA